jgi:DHA1 family bicyclomycin/chloramphenicol resistance-like MFS transporter
VGLAIYVIGAVGSAFAPNFAVLAGFHFLWGLGTAGPRSLSLAIARDLHSGDWIARILALVQAVFMVMPAFAPLLGEGESLAPEHQRPLTLGRTRAATAAMFDLGSFAVFLGSGELIFDATYDRSSQFAYLFGAMSLAMGLVVWRGSALRTSGSGSDS